MSLTEIASSMKAVARREGTTNAVGSTNQPMARGAHLTLEYTRGQTLETFTLTIMRAGKAPQTERAIKAWQTEINTFARYFVPIGTPHTFPTPPPAPRYMYNAQVQWNEPLRVPSTVPPTPPAVRAGSEPAPTVRTDSLPRTPEEIAAWARTIGPGIKIRNVDVFTGEL